MDPVVLRLSPMDSSRYVDPGSQAWKQHEWQRIANEKQYKEGFGQVSAGEPCFSCEPAILDEGLQCPGLSDFLDLLW